jgi:hypothetical protein
LIAALGGLAFMAATPLGLILSAIGAFVDRNKKPAIFGLGVSLAIGVLFFFVALCR